ncbi:MAG: AAA family ATPase [Alphaproteobacteria bacterium]|nr:AAA family ATPase [Alphaproteobacteria bacterium]
MTSVMVCCGVGGTGKTTTAAALAVAHAMAGKRTVVLTIDPARRLATALGVELGNDPVPIAGLPPEAAPLAGLMLDRKGTWDALVRRYARDDAHAARLLANPYYQSVATRLTGSHEYMAIEKLHELVESGAWDLVVLDTPPAQHVVDFFEAPERIEALLDKGAVSALLRPRSGLVGAATRRALALVERLAGDQVMAGITEFFELFGELSVGLQSRSAAVAELLRSDATRFLLVTDAGAPERSDALGFLEELHRRRMRFHGFLVNRTAPRASFARPLGATDLVRPPGLTDAAWADWERALLEVPRLAAERARAHRENARALRDRAPDAAIWLVPEVPGGVRTLEGLVGLAGSLPPAPPTAL